MISRYDSARSHCVNNASSSSGSKTAACRSTALTAITIAKKSGSSVVAVTPDVIVLSPIGSHSHGRRTSVFITESLTKDNVRGKGKFAMSRANRFTLICVAALAILASTAGNAHAGALTGDPRQCAVSSPSYCARTAAIATVRSVMAKRAGVAKWNDYLSCKPRYGNLLQWQCAHFNSQHQADTINVLFRATSSGWKRVVTVTANP